MNKQRFLFPFLFLLVTISACNEEETPAKELGPFTTINANGGVTFKLVQGASNHVVSTSLNEASYNVNNEELSINATGGSMTIAVDDLDLLSCNACAVKNSGLLVLDTLRLSIHAGSTDLHDLQITDLLELSAINTGTYEFTGTATFLKLSLVNATHFKGYALLTDSTHVNSLNAYDVEVHATEVLDASILSSGNINYKGNPKVVRVSGTGTGQAVKK